MNTLSKSEIYDQLGSINARVREKQIEYASEMLGSSRQNRETHKNIHQNINNLEEVLDRALAISGKKLQRKS